MTDENLSSLAKKVPDLGDYSMNNRVVDFSKPLDNQLYSLFKFDENDIKYVESVIDNIDKKRGKNGGKED
jgi:hypothetical protein